MTDFDDRFAERGGPRLMTAFGESVVYKPHGGAPRTITAMVTRDPLVSDENGVVSSDLIVEVYNDSTTGIESDRLTLGQDKIEVAGTVGSTPRDRSVLSILGQVGGMLTLQVR